MVDKLVQSDKSHRSEEEKRRDVQGILNLILPCHATLHLAFPIHRYVLTHPHICDLTIVELSLVHRCSIHSAYLLIVMYMYSLFILYSQTIVEMMAVWR